MTTQTEEALRDLASDRRHKFWGKYRATVVDVSSGADLGKLTLSVPEVYGTTNSPLAWPCVPFAGPKHGFVAVPEAGDGVWVEFEAGDPSRPIWVGCWWGQNDMPSPSDTNVRTWITSGGLQVVLDDGQSQISLVHPDGASIVMTKTDITLSMGSTSLKIDSDAITATGTVKVGS